MASGREALVRFRAPGASEWVHLERGSWTVWSADRVNAQCGEYRRKSLSFSLQSIGLAALKCRSCHSVRWPDATRRPPIAGGGFYV